MVFPLHKDKVCTVGGIWVDDVDELKIELK